MNPKKLRRNELPDRQRQDPRGSVDKTRYSQNSYKKHRRGRKQGRETTCRTEIEKVTGLKQQEATLGRNRDDRENILKADHFLPAAFTFFVVDEVAFLGAACEQGYQQRCIMKPESNERTFLTAPAFFGPVGTFLAETCKTKIVKLALVNIPTSDKSY